MIFGSAVFAGSFCMYTSTVFDRIGLFRCAQGPKLTTVINGLAPRLVQHKQNTGTNCIVKPQDRSRVFRSSPKINSKKDQNWANETIVTAVQNRNYSLSCQEFYWKKVDILRFQQYICYPRNKNKLADMNLPIQGRF